MLTPQPQAHQEVLQLFKIPITGLMGACTEDTEEWEATEVVCMVVQEAMEECMVEWVWEWEECMV